MITILPPELKEQVRYSKYNVVARHYLIAAVLILCAVGGTLFAGHRYADDQISEYELSLEEVRAETAQFESLQEDVGELNTRLKTIEDLLKSRTSFTEVLTDLASVLPDGAFINGISLTGEVDQPLELTITAQSRGQGLILRNALLTSPRIASADIQSISPDTTSTGFHVVIVIGFDKEEVS